MSYNLESAKGGQVVVVGTEFTECRALWVGTAGDVNVQFAHGGSCIYSNVSGRLDVNAVNVLASGTTASNISTMI